MLPTRARAARRGCADLMNHGPVAGARDKNTNESRAIVELRLYIYMRARSYRRKRTGSGGAERINRSADLSRPIRPELNGITCLALAGALTYIQGEREMMTLQLTTRALTFCSCYPSCANAYIGRVERDARRLLKWGDFSADLETARLYGYINCPRARATINLDCAYTGQLPERIRVERNLEALPEWNLNLMELGCRTFLHRGNIIRTACERR